MRGVLGGIRFSLRAYLAYPDTLIPLFIAPIYMVVFVSVLRQAGREDLETYALVAPGCIAVVWYLLYQGAWVIQVDLWESTIDQAVSSPAGYPAAILGRILGIAAVALTSFVEAWLVGRYLLGIEVSIDHPVWLVAGILATGFATAATALLFCALFVLSRSAATFSNSAMYPLLVLGGILAPIPFLPDWLEPLSKAIFLSWAADLLRAATRPQPVPDAWLKLGMVLGLGLATLVLAAGTLRRILDRLRRTGSLGLA